MLLPGAVYQSGDNYKVYCLITKTYVPALAEIKSPEEANKCRLGLKIVKAKPAAEDIAPFGRKRLSDKVTRRVVVLKVTGVTCSITA